MHASKPAETERTRWRIRALSAWKNEDGTACPALPSPTPDLPESKAPPKLTDAELVQLRIRVIALENLVIALLAEAPQWQLERVRVMATHISPSPGFTPYPMTTAAATEMLSLAARSEPFRSIPPRDL